jgi:beta-lactamase regulating signal transducer with metallopeptidase domain
MSDYFVLLLEQVTIFSSVTALILIAVKQLFRCRIPPRIGMALWIILLARLICPVFPESRISVYNLIPAGKEILYAIRSGDEAVSEAPESESVREANPYVLTDPGGAEETLPPPPPSGGSAPDYTIGGYLTDGSEEKSGQINRIVLTAYACGVCVSLCSAGLVYFLAKKRALRGTIPVDDPRLLSAYRDIAGEMGLDLRKLPRPYYGSSTMLAGVVRPRLVLRETDFAAASSEKAAERTARMLFAHELTHYRYGDNPLLVFSTLVNCLFWFNPLIWLVRRMLREDVEVLCDARTLEFCGIPGTEYALMLCRESAFDALTDGFADRFAAAAGCHMSLKGRHLKNRLLTISHHSRKRFLPTAVSWLLCFSIIAVCLTNPVLSHSGEYSAYIGNYARLSGEDRDLLSRKDTATVSDYLGAVRVLLRYTADVSVTSSLEQLKRAVGNTSAGNPDNAFLGWLNREISGYKADEVLTVRSAAAINEAVLTVLGIGYSEKIPDGLLPSELSVSAMNAILTRLPETEGEELLSAYNKGVQGADVRFDAFYTDEMMALIESRILNDWNREKFCGFYHKIAVTPEDRQSFSDELNTAVSDGWTVSSVYIRDPGLTKVEEATLIRILGAAEAGEREDVYYLKRTEDVISKERAALLIAESGFTAYDALTDRAWIGDPSTAGTDDPSAGGKLKTTVTAVRGGLRDEGVLYEAVGLRRSEDLFRLLDRSYRTGLTDAPDGLLDPAQKLSAGEGIALAYRLAAAVSEP